MDDPRATVANADSLVTEVMKVRGYPMGDFEQRAATSQWITHLS